MSGRQRRRLVAEEEFGILTRGHQGPLAVLELQRANDPVLVLPLQRTEDAGARVKNSPIAHEGATCWISDDVAQRCHSVSKRQALLLAHV